MLALIFMLNVDLWDHDHSSTRAMTFSYAARWSVILFIARRRRVTFSSMSCLDCSRPASNLPRNRLIHTSKKIWHPPYPALMCNNHIHVHIIIVMHVLLGQHCYSYGCSIGLSVQCVV